MQKVFFRICLAVLLLSLTGCSKEEHKIRVGVAQCTTDVWRTKLNSEIMREALVNDDVEVEIRSAMDIVSQQIEDIDYFVDNDFDVLVVAPLYDDSITPAIRRAYEKGIPVLVFDRAINDTCYTAYRGTDNYRIGKAAAQLAYSWEGRSLHVAEIMGAPGSTPRRQRHRGFFDELSRLDLFDYSVGSGNWHTASGQRVADSLLRLHPDINVIFAHNDRMAIGARRAADSLGLKEIRIIGVDGLPNTGIRAVEDGVLDATILYSTQGIDLLRTAIRLAKHQPVMRDSLYFFADPIDKSMSKMLLAQDDVITDSNRKIQQMQAKVDDYWDRHTTQTILLYSFIAIALLLALVIFFLIRAYWTNYHHRLELKQHNRRLDAKNRELEASQAELRRMYGQYREAMQSKLVFFTNVSHDLRTPLTLIADPVEQIAKADNLTPQQQTLMRLADKNVKILLRLINEILDFRKLESGKLTLSLQEVDLRREVEDWTQSFRNLARQRHVRFTVEMPEEETFTLALDLNKYERIFFNLLSNAFKFTPENGSVSVSFAIENGLLVLRVADTGRGIPPKEVERIFEQFYQVDKLDAHGSGIGLTLVKAFAELHGGTVTAQGEPGRGSTFTVKVPVKHVEQLSGDEQLKAILLPSDDAIIRSAEEVSEVEPAEEAQGDGRPTVLVIVDNADIRTLIQSILGSCCKVLHAEEGQQGIKIASTQIPDLIICDVMMPGIDGMETCSRLKQEFTTSHIPVLMLTACALDRQRIEGYNCGADGYLTKPFNAAVLVARCDALIANRKRIYDALSPSYIGVAPTTSAPSSTISSSTSPASLAGAQSGSAASLHGASPSGKASGGNGAANGTSQATPPSGPDDGTNMVRPSVRPDIDNEFYRRFAAYVQQEMSRADLTVEEMADEMGMSRVQLYRKLKALTNYSPAELLRNMRLKRAAELLRTTERNVSEIAYEVGFSSPSYFTKCYRDFFGEAPTDAQRRTSKII